MSAWPGYHSVCTRIVLSLTWEWIGRGAVSTGASILFTAQRRGWAGFGGGRVAGELTGFTVWEGAERKDKSFDIRSLKTVSTVQKGISKVRLDYVIIFFYTFPADEGSFAQSTLRVLHQVVF